MGTLLISALFAAFVLFVLAAIMVMVAWRADHAITIKGPMASLGELEAQIAGKKHLRDDLEAEVQKASRNRRGLRVQTGRSGCAGSAKGRVAGRVEPA
ncbi:hypothetical protein ACFOHS_19900 [Jhaorihella thermophila]